MINRSYSRKRRISNPDKYEENSNIVRQSIENKPLYHKIEGARFGFRNHFELQPCNISTGAPEKPLSTSPSTIMSIILGGMMMSSTNLANFDSAA